MAGYYARQTCLIGHIISNYVARFAGWHHRALVLDSKELLVSQEGQCRVRRPVGG
jgi:hypothetical protein